MTATKLIKYITLLLIFSLVACSTSPTGRRQVILFPSSDLAQMGQQAFVKMKEQTSRSRSARDTKMVQCVTNQLLKHVSSNVFNGKWEVVVFNDQQVNAFALPGGKIGVYEGLLDVAQTQDQLAAVIGHEIGHVIAQHGNERMSTSTLAQLGQQVVGQVLAANEVAQTPQIMQALGVGLQFGTLKYSRVHESEADLIGLDLMAKAGFDPTQSIVLWQNMAKNSGPRQPEFLSTHPSPSTRINDLNNVMAKAVQIYKQAPARPSCQF